VIELTKSPWGGFVVFCGYAIAAIVIAAILMARRYT